MTLSSICPTFLHIRLVRFHQGICLATALSRDKVAAVAAAVEIATTAVNRVRWPYSERAIVVSWVVDLLAIYVILSFMNYAT